MSEVRQIYYRGSLKFCNYSCSYCPFSKGKRSERQLEQDEKELFRFVELLQEKEFRGAVQIVPYGEALIHKYYWEALAKLSKLPNIEAVGAQSNFSFPVSQMLQVFEQAGGQKEKLRLWGTFHPEMVSVEKFLSQCQTLQREEVLFCVGAVGVPKETSLLQTLRRELDSSVYMWINKMDGLGRNYTEEEKKTFCEIDEYFELELRHHKANPQRCGSATLIDAKGDMYSCNLCRQKIGNIYAKDFEDLLNAERICKRKECDCYISYSNRKDMEELVFFHPYPAFRIPFYRRAVFFDVDGTLVFEGEKEINERRATWLRRLAGHSNIYLATSLPFEDAMKKVRPVADVICGGVFAGGGRLRWKEQAETKECFFPLEVKWLKRAEELQKEFGFRIRKYTRKNVIYKVVFSFFSEQILEEEQQLLENELWGGNLDFHIVKEENKWEITAKETGKLAGIRHICEMKGMTLREVAVFGNSEADLEMMKAVSFSVAAKGSSEQVKKAATIHVEGML